MRMIPAYHIADTITDITGTIDDLSLFPVKIFDRLLLFDGSDI